MRQGRTLAVTVRTRPNADIAFAVAFSDGKGHQTQSLGQANGEGIYTTSLVITPEMPTGPANMAIASGIGGEGAGTEFPFTVVKAGASCD